MDQPTAVWILIGVSLIAANLPFLVERPFLVFPWNLEGARVRSWWWSILSCILFLAVLIGWTYSGIYLIGHASVGTDLMSVIIFMGTLLLVVGVTVLLLSYAGWREHGRPIQKSFFERLLEVLMFYGLAGALGFAFETNISDPFPQRWEFYAVTVSLFVVLGYPGFVYRYLMRHTKAPKATSRIDKNVSA